MRPMTTLTNETKTSAYVRWRARLSERFGVNRTRSTRSGGVDLVSVMIAATIIGVCIASGVAVANAFVSQR